MENLVKQIKYCGRVLEGDEMSYFVISDGLCFKVLIQLKIVKELAKVTR